MLSKLTIHLSLAVGCALGLFLLSCTNRNTIEAPYLLVNGYGVNGVTLMVNDRDKALSFYQDTLGFDLPAFQVGAYDGTLVTPVSFADNSTLEILGLNDTSSTQTSFIKEFLSRHQGARLFSLSSSSVDSTFSLLKAVKLKPDSVQSYRVTEASEGWSGDDGRPQRKSLDFNRLNPPSHLPQFIEHTDFDFEFTRKNWRTYYGYWREFRQQPNGVVGTAAIRVAVDNLPDAIKVFSTMGFKKMWSNDTLARFHLFRTQEIHLLAKSSNLEVAKFLDQRGPGIFAVRFEVANLDSTRSYLSQKMASKSLQFDHANKILKVPGDYAYGLQLEFVQEPQSQGALAKVLQMGEELDDVAAKHAAGLYSKYCALCHGKNREGYAADHAPSLKSHSLLASSEGSNFMRYTIQYGRANTAMGGYLDSQGGPMEYIDIELLLKWLYQEADVKEPVEISREPVMGDIEMGKSVYIRNCAVCHGASGKGVSAPALGNPMLLATATDDFLRYAIREGRDGTPMISFKDQLSEEEIDGVTAFLRSRASGWDVPEGGEVKVPTPEDYVLNPKSQSPDFTLRSGKYVSAKQLKQALDDSLRVIILDARSEVAWRQMHIPGAVPVPYYEEPENFVEDIPKDGTWIVVYCACPHAASDRVVQTLRRNGFENTAIMDEGILVWAQWGFPVESGN